MVEGVSRGRGQPPNPHTAAGIALVAAGLTPEEAAEQLTEQLQATLPRGATDKERRGARISGKTIRRAMASGAAPPRPETARGDQPPGRLSSASGTIPTHATGAGKAFLQRGGDQESLTKSNEYSDGGQPLPGNIPGPLPPAPKDPLALRARLLEELCEVAPTMPLHQQDRLLGTLPLERLRREAIARGIAPYHEAAAAVARELRAVRL